MSRAGLPDLPMSGRPGCENEDMPTDETWLSPAAKKAARDSTRRAVRARKRDIVQAMRADWDDRDADTYNLLDAAFAADGENRMTPWLLFGIASRAISDLSAETGTDREELLTRLLG
jgi:hypothetical protein